MKKVAIFISGRGSNMQAIIEQCQNGILKGIAEPVLVFSNKIEAKGLDFAKEAGISTECIPSKGLEREEFDKKVIDLLVQYKPNYIILAGYMRILSPFFTKSYPKRIINIHPADTKLHQGLHAYDWAFKNGLESTKITVHFVDEGLDTGEIIEQATVDLKGVSSLQEVEQRGLKVEHKLYSQAIKTVILNQK